MQEIKVEYLPIEQVIPYANNARKHGDEDTDAIMASIREFGFTNPILVWKNIICAGHGRLIAAKRLGMDKVPVIHLDYLTDEQRKAYILADNKTAELSGWDFDILAAEPEDISDIDMSQFGFDVSSVNDDYSEYDEADNDFDDIEKLEKHYGVPYQGNKSRIADIIVSILPEGERLVDLFGGGGGDDTLCDALREVEFVPLQ